MAGTQAGRRDESDSLASRPNIKDITSKLFSTSDHFSFSYIHLNLTYIQSVLFYSIGRIPQGGRAIQAHRSCFVY